MSSCSHPHRVDEDDPDLDGDNSIVDDDTASISDLPPETLHHIFQYLGAVDSLTRRLVCQNWREISTGTIFLKLTPSSSTVVIWQGVERFFKYNPGVKLKGRRRQKQPPQYRNDSTQELLQPVEVCPISEFSAAVRMESSSTTTTSSSSSSAAWRSIDLANSVALIMYLQGSYRRFRPVDPYWTLQLRLQEVDLGGLAALENLSMDGCICLERVTLPKCLKVLTVDNCTSLVDILIPWRTSMNIKTLHIVNCVSLKMDHSCSIFSSAITTTSPFTSTETLDASGCYVNVIERILSNTMSLRQLSLTKTKSIQPCIMVLLRSGPLKRSLQELSLCGSPGLSLGEIDAIVYECKHLWWLNTNACDIPSIDQERIQQILELRRSQDFGRKCNGEGQRQIMEAGRSSSPTERKRPRSCDAEDKNNDD